MQVGFDASALETNTTGASEYQRQLLDALLALPDGPALTAYTPRNLALPERPRLTVRPMPWNAGDRTVRIARGALGWRRRWAADRLDLLHVPFYYLPPGAPRCSVVTVYDVRFARFPDTYPPGRRTFLRLTVPWTLRRARHIVAISTFTKREIVDGCGVPPDRISVIPLAARAAFRPTPDAATLDRLRASHLLPEHFILAVGTLEPRKNLVRTVEALALLRDRGLPHHLVLAGMTYFGEGPLHAAIARHGLEGRVHLRGFVPDEELPALYSLAELFVYPSLYEGFGIPVLEAMACGTPVAASGTTSVPEVAGDAALLFDPTDVAAMADAMARMLEDSALAARLRAAGLARSAQFTWERTARETMAVYARCLEGDRA